MADSRAAVIAQPRLVTQLLALFAASALALAAVGLYGVLAFGVVQRTREIGVRMALGASAGSVLGMLVRRGLILTAAGLAIGLAAASALARLLSSLLFATAWLDPATFIGVPALFGAVALAASLVPARRAARIDPQQALREG